MTVNDQAANRPDGSRITIYLLTTAVVLLAARFAAGIMTEALSLVSLAVFAGIDIARFMTGHLSGRHTHKPLRNRPNPGLSKIPAILGIALGIIFILAAVFIFREAGRRLDEALPPGQYFAAIGVLAVCLASAIVVSLKTGKTVPGGFRLFSRGELILSLAVLAVLIIVQAARFQSLDPVASIFLAIFILIKSLRLLLDSIKEGLDSRLAPQELEWIKGLILAYAGRNYSISGLSARRSGHKCYIDFRLAVNDLIDLDEAFETANGLEKELIRKIPEAIVIIHVQK